MQLFPHLFPNPLTPLSPGGEKGFVFINLLLGSCRAPGTIRTCALGRSPAPIVKHCTDFLGGADRAWQGPTPCMALQHPCFHEACVLSTTMWTDMFPILHPNVAQISVARQSSLARHTPCHQHVSSAFRSGGQDCAGTQSVSGLVLRAHSASHLTGHAPSTNACRATSRQLPRTLLHPAQDSARGGAVPEKPRRA